MMRENVRGVNQKSPANFPREFPRFCVLWFSILSPTLVSEIADPTTPPKLELRELGEL